MKSERRIPIALVALNVALLLLVPIAPAKAQTALTVLSDVTVTSQPDALTVHVKTSREPKYRAELIDTPSRLIVDLEDAVYAWRKTPLAVGAEPLRQIRGSQYRKGIARVVFELRRDVGYAIREEGDGGGWVSGSVGSGGPPRRFRRRSAWPRRRPPSRPTARG